MKEHGPSQTFISSLKDTLRYQVVLKFGMLICKFPCYSLTLLFLNYLYFHMSILCSLSPMEEDVNLNFKVISILCTKRIDDNDNNKQQTKVNIWLEKLPYSAKGLVNLQITIISEIIRKKNTFRNNISMCKLTKIKSL